MPTRLDAYVEELRQELGVLPITQRAEQLAEVRLHLDTLKAANLELGLTEEEAEVAAIAQMGKPLQTTSTTQPAYGKSWFQGPFFAAHTFLTVGCLMCVIGMTGSRNFASMQTMANIPFILPLLLLGWSMGMLVGKRQALLAIPLAPIPPLVMMYGFIFMNRTHMRGNLTEILFGPLALVGVFAAPVLLGVLLLFRLPSRRRKLA